MSNQSSSGDDLNLFGLARELVFFGKEGLLPIFLQKYEKATDKERIKVFEAFRIDSEDVRKWKQELSSSQQEQQALSA